MTSTHATPARAAGAARRRLLRRLQPRLRLAVRPLRAADRAADPHAARSCSSLYAGLIGLTGCQFSRAPTGFIPDQDQGYLITVIQLPPGASLARTDAVVREATDIILKTPGRRARGAVRRLRRRDLHQRAERRRDLLAARSRSRSASQDGHSAAVDPRRPAQAARRHPGRVHHRHPAAAGRRHRHCRRLQDDAAGPAAASARRRSRAAAQEIAGAANAVPGLVGVFTPFSTRTPQHLRRYRPRTRARSSACPPDKVFEAMQVYLGSAYVNDFNYLGRTYQVTAQADAPLPREHRRHRAPEDAQCERRDGADRLGRAAARRRPGPIACRATICSRRRRCRAARCPASPRATRSRRWRSSRPSICRRASAIEWTDLAYQQQLGGQHRRC